MNNKLFLSQILSLLEQEGIENRDQLYNYPSVLTTTTNCYNEIGKNWVFELYIAVKEYFKTFASKNSRPTHFVSTELDDNTLKYICIFPSSLVLTEPFITASICGTAGTAYRINRSFLEQVLKNRDYIEQDIFSFLPRSFDLAMAYSSGWEVTTLSGRYTYRTPEYCNRNPLQILDNNGISLTKERINDLFLEFPFLYGARVEDYKNITTKYERHYRLYRSTIQKFMTDLDNNGKSITELYYEIQQAHQEMQIQFETERSNLIRKGIHTVVGVAIACIPFAVDIPADLRVFLQSVLGTMSLKELSKDIGETQKNLKMLQQNPYFVTWRWMRKSPS